MLIFQYTFFSFVTAVLLLSVGIMAFVFKNRVTKNEDKKISEIFRKYNNKVTERPSMVNERKTINAIQTKVIISKVVN